ncbi:aminopeptidase P family protein [Marinicella sp. S1101]|uniref:M24 family metallopeptidase n=1 Tax=Marinicella marina TaxID=2996016 RepID=UPI002260EC09|nr:aminopeptidase P family protein [Marinicella marina]MCX7552729.1 aminopeptidase P family protein [Marinicella marina]MDJ1139962.1 aminopeptidase P family protein [Marinicella marina]
MTERLNTIIKTLNSEQLDGFLLFDANNITYLSGFTGHAATALVLGQHAYLLTDYRYFEQAKAECSVFEVICRDRIKQSLAELIAELLLKHGIRRLAFEADHISHSAWLGMQTHWPETDAVPFSRLVEDLRYTKDDGEIASIQQAAKIADDALHEMLKSVKAGVTERELAAELEYQMAQRGSQGPSFDTIMLMAERSALPHGVPGDRQLQHGDLLLIDFGAVVNGYHSDMTRTFVFGQADEKQRTVYQTVLGAQQAAMDALSEEVEGLKLHQASQHILNQSPYAKYQGEGLGHGLGMDVHELPFIGMGKNLMVKRNCVITIEPGIYIPGWGGVRVEDDVVLTDNGLVQLTQFPREMIEL